MNCNFFHRRLQNSLGVRSEDVRFSKYSPTAHSSPIISCMRQTRHLHSRKTCPSDLYLALRTQSSGSNRLLSSSSLFAMPSLRGIEISLTTEPFNDRVPEFPHPEGSSARLIGSHSGSSKQESISTPKTGPTIAVYIPSVPGTALLSSRSVQYELTVRL